MKAETSLNDSAQKPTFHAIVEILSRRRRVFWRAPYFAVREGSRPTGNSSGSTALPALCKCTTNLLIKHVLSDSFQKSQISSAHLTQVMTVGIEKIHKSISSSFEDPMLHANTYYGWKSFHVFINIIA